LKVQVEHSSLEGLSGFRKLRDFKLEDYWAHNKWSCHNTRNTAASALSNCTLPAAEHSKTVFFPSSLPFLGTLTQFVVDFKSISLNSDNIFGMETSDLKILKIFGVNMTNTTFREFIASLGNIRLLQDLRIGRLSFAVARSSSEIKFLPMPNLQKIWFEGQYPLMLGLSGRMSANLFNDKSKYPALAVVNICYANNIFFPVMYNDSLDRDLTHNVGRSCVPSTTECTREYEKPCFWQNVKNAYSGGS
jgi:hypothetical protein